MQTLRNILDKTLGFICVLLFVFMTIIGTYQIITRYVFQAPSTISEELLTYSFTWMALLATALVFGKGDHMRMEFIADKLKGKPALVLSIISELLVMAFAAFVLLYGGIRITKLTMTQVTASLGVSMATIYIVLPICGVIILIYGLINITGFIHKINANDY
jgi:TRAP-type C4-dicarboxylate transport system permease small subunit